MGGGGQKGGGSDSKPIYKPASSSLLESLQLGTTLAQLIGSNPGFAGILQTPQAEKALGKLGLTPEMISGMKIPNSQIDYSGLLDMAKQIPTGGINPTVSATAANNPFQFQAQNISNINPQVYQNMRQQTFEDISRQQNQAQQQANRAYSKSGLGRSAPGGVQKDIARSGLEAQSTASRGIAGQEAASGVDVAKFNAGQNFGTQQAQAGENQNRSNFGLQQAQEAYRQALQSQQAMSQGLSQRIGTMGSLQQQQQNQAMQPYGMASNLYNSNIGIPNTQGARGGKGDPFSAILGAGANIATAFA